MQFMIVTGMSGAGKSRAMAALEDLGYYCVDNLPVALIPTFAQVCMAAAEQYQKVALVTDVRAGRSFEQIEPALDSLRAMGCDYRILFLDTATQTLINRFKETRRKHPLMSEGLSMTESIQREREMLEGLRGRADYVVNTTRLTAAGLRDHLVKLFSPGGSDSLFEVVVQSFGFKYGIPTEADLVFDVRFLPNPYYEISLREHNGTEEEVRDYVFQDGTADELMRHLTSLIDFLIPQYITEGKTSLVICVGCTGGKHRSVAITEALAAHIRSKKSTVTVNHRDVHR